MTIEIQELLLAFKVRELATAYRSAARDAAKATIDMPPAPAEAPVSPTSEEFQAYMKAVAEEGRQETAYAERRANFTAKWYAEHPLSEFVPAAFEDLTRVRDQMSALMNPQS